MVFHLGGRSFRELPASNSIFSANSKLFTLINSFFAGILEESKEVRAPKYNQEYMAFSARRFSGQFWALVGATFLGFLGIGTVLPQLAPHVRYDLHGTDQGSEALSCHTAHPAATGAAGRSESARTGPAHG